VCGFGRTLFTVIRDLWLSLPSANLIKFELGHLRMGVCDFVQALAWTQFRSSLNLTSTISSSSLLQYQNFFLGVFQIIDFNMDAWDLLCWVADSFFLLSATCAPQVDADSLCFEMDVCCGSGDSDFNQTWSPWDWNIFANRLYWFFLLTRRKYDEVHLEPQIFLMFWYVKHNNLKFRFSN